MLEDCKHAVLIDRGLSQALSSNGHTRNIAPGANRTAWRKQPILLGLECALGIDFGAADQNRDPNGPCSISRERRKTFPKPVDRLSSAVTDQWRRNGGNWVVRRQAAIDMKPGKADVREVSKPSGCDI